MTLRPYGSTRLFTASLALLASLAPVARAQFGPRQTVGDLNAFGSFDQAFFDQSGDGDLDLFATSGNNVLYLRNDGLSGYASAVAIVTGAGSALGLVAVDVDDDGDMDLVYCSSAGNAVRWVEQLPSEQWAAPQDVGPLNSAWQLEARDLDADGRVDIVATGHGPNVVSWFRQSSPGVFDPPVTIASTSTPPTEVRVRDFDGNGALDVAAASFATGGVTVTLATSPGVFGSPVTIPVSSSASTLRGLVAEDFDLDGDVDLVYSAEGGGVLGLLRNSGAGVFNSEAILDVGLQNLLDVESADLDANGFPDLVVAASGASRIRWYFNDVFGFGPPNVAPEAGFAPISVKVADVDGDVDLDLLNAEGYFNPNTLTIGSASCVGEPNSTGVPGELAATGLARASEAAIALKGTSLPPFQFTLLLAARDMGSVPGLGGGEGTLCLGGPIGRFNGLLGAASPGGEILLRIDLDAIPTPSALVAVLPGDTWYFQLWHRDAGVAGPTSNLTGAVRVDFQ